MKRIKEFAFQLFHFNKQERQGVFVLAIIIFLLFALRLLIPLIINKSALQIINPVEGKVEAPVIAESNGIRFNKKTDYPKGGELFVFNPNEVSGEDLLRLGFSEKLAQTMLKFRSKGGTFRKAEDLKKLYGLSPALYEKLAPYILIPAKSSNRDSLNVEVKYHKAAATKALLDLNSADSVALVSLRGIGPAFSKRILKYRTMLGGFYSVEQIREVYGMTDSLYALIMPQIIADTAQIHKIPINAVDVASLRKHLYFNYQVANAIINYRNKHGRLTKKDIEDMGVFTEDKLKKILPYLSF